MWMFQCWGQLDLVSLVYLVNTEVMAEFGKVDVDQQEAMDYRQKRRTLTVLDLVQNDNVDLSLKDVDQAIMLLDHEITNGLLHCVYTFFFYLFQ